MVLMCSVQARWHLLPPARLLGAAAPLMDPFIVMAEVILTMRVPRVLGAVTDYEDACRQAAGPQRQLWWWQFLQRFLLWLRSLLGSKP